MITGTFVDRLGCPFPVPSLLHGLPAPFLGFLSMQRVGPRELADCHVQLHTIPATEAEAAERFAALRWPNGWRCPSCGHAEYGTNASRPRERICRGCGARRSVTAGTGLHKKHDLRRWFAAAIVLGSGRQASARAFAAEWGCDVKTAWSTLHALRAVQAAVTAWRPRQEAHQQRVVCRVVCRADRPTRRPRRLNDGATRRPDGRWTQGRTVVAHAGGLAWTEEPSRAAQRAPFGEAAAVARYCAGVLLRVHRTVSPRWIGRYRDALLARVLVARVGQCARTAWLVWAAQAPPRGWTEVVPS